MTVSALGCYTQIIHKLLQFWPKTGRKAIWTYAQAAPKIKIRDISKPIGEILTYHAWT